MRWREIGLPIFEQCHRKGPGILLGLGEDPVRDRPRRKGVAPASGSVERPAHQQTVVDPGQTLSELAGGAAP